jgi:hypothetical protein
MKRTVVTVILTLAFTAFALHAVEQTAFKATGIIESTEGGFKFPDGSVQLSASQYVAPTTGHGKIDLAAVSDSVQETVTFTQHVMVRHVQFMLQKFGDPSDQCFVSARKTSPSGISFLIAHYQVGNQGIEVEQFSLGSGVEFQIGEDMTIGANAPYGGECYLSLIYFFDILD